MLLFATAGIGLSLNGICIANYGYVDVNDIGEGDDNALLCYTDNTDCCRSYLAGEWYYPSGMKVETDGRSEGAEFYRNRGTRVVRLNYRQGSFTERGLFKCEVPDASNTTQHIHVYIGMSILW